MLSTEILVCRDCCRNPRFQERMTHACIVAHTCTHTAHKRTHARSHTYNAPTHTLAHTHTQKVHVQQQTARLSRSAACAESDVPWVDMETEERGRKDGARDGFGRMEACWWVAGWWVGRFGDLRGAV